jgi:hypothetical protein
MEKSYGANFWRPVPASVLANERSELVKRGLTAEPRGRTPLSYAA